MNTACLFVWIGMSVGLGVLGMNGPLNCFTVSNKIVAQICDPVLIGDQVNCLQKLLQK